VGEKNREAEKRGGGESRFLEVMFNVATRVVRGEKGGKGGYPPSRNGTLFRCFGEEGHIMSYRVEM